MIKLQMLNDQYIYLNPDFIEIVEAGAENNQRNTIVKIHDGTSYVVQESPEAIVQSIAQWRSRCHAPLTGDYAGESGAAEGKGVL